MISFIILHDICGVPNLGLGLNAHFEIRLHIDKDALFSMKNNNIKNDWKNQNREVSIMYD